jgi:hypothetical protein
MPEKDPTTYSMITYAWVVGLSCWGGVVNYLRKVREGHTARFSFTEFVGELVTSGFVGVVTFWLCEMADLSQLLSAAFIGIAGHMGSRAIFTIEQALKSWVENRVG